MDRIEARRQLKALGPHLALWVALVALVAGFTAFQIVSQRRAELGGGQVEAENLARVLQDHTTRTLEGFDRALSLMKALHERGGGDAYLTPLARSMEHTMSTDVERVFNRFDRDGVLAASSQPDARPGEVSIADRPYFADARDRPGAAIRIGEPVIGRVSGVTVIPLVKRLETADGGFDGVLGVALDPARMVHLFRSLRVGESSSVGLMDREGRVWVWSENHPVERRSSRADPAEAAVPGRVDTRMADGPLQFSEIAGERSVSAIAAVPGTSLVAFAVLDEDTLLAHHRVFAANLAGYAALVVAFLTVPIALAARRALGDVRRRRVLELRYADAQQRASTDPLTGAANREAFDSRLGSAWETTTRDGVPFVLAFLDVDRFKALNDTYGHETGDRALRRVADTIAGSVRRSDVVARLGGDEFAVLMPGADLNAAQRVFDGLEETLRLAMQEEGWPISFSVGVVAFETAPPHPRDAVAIADRLMYEVKGAGRNATRYGDYRDRVVRRADAVERLAA
jgi:diguanylate cyclase (GGDEF)-like protein